MNEQIKILAEQAGIVIPKDSEYNGHIYRNSIEKFAKLIVQECEQVSLTCSHRDDDMGAIIARQIKKHFGVKE